ncbi:MAG: methionyl-tRNA formyltransferase [Clostridiaceae bacterium]|nr:methionyl-tRNA formyltransferase [Clostridiaceae bacterium]
MTVFAFMGTPEFSTIILDHLEAAGFLPALLVTQPDRPYGRGRRMTPSPVALWAQERGLEVVKPQDRKDPILESALSALSPLFVITAAFGLILPANLLDLPARGSLNLHASLLPRYRGASPIQAALLSGDKETGVTLMRMDEGMDTGPILARSAMAIPDDMDAGQLNLELAHLAGRLMVDHFQAFVDGQLKEEIQDERLASITRLLRKADGEVDFSLEAQDVHNHIRAMNPWPGAFAFLQGKRYKLNRARLFEGQLPGQAGQLHILGRRMIVSCGQGALELLEIQPQSGSAMACQVCAHNFESGSVFDPCSRPGHDLV